MIHVVTDSTSDLPPDVVDELPITVVPAYVNLGQRSVKDDASLDRGRFYGELAGYHPYPTTAAPAPGEFAAVYEDLAARGVTHIISVHVAASLSGILNAARSGANLAPDCPVTLVDSGQLTMGLGLQVLAAARLAQAGEPPQTIVAYLEALRPHVYTLAVLETLDALQRSGRVSRLVAGIGNLLQVKPIILVYDGEVTAAERVRTHSRALRRMVDHALDKGAIRQVAYLNTNTEGRYEEMVALLGGRLPADAERFEVTACPAIGVHIGAGAVGVVVVCR